MNDIFVTPYSPLNREITPISKLKENDWVVDTLFSKFCDLCMSAWDCIRNWHASRTITNKTKLVDFNPITAIFNRRFGFVGLNEVQLFLQSKGPKESDNLQVIPQVFNDEIYVPEDRPKPLLIPIVVDRHIVTVYIEGDKIIYYDPQGFDIATRGGLLDVLKKISTNIHTITMNGKVQHEQKNRTDCGVICLSLMEHIIDGKPIESFTPDFENSSATRLQRRRQLNTDIETYTRRSHRTI